MRKPLLYIKSLITAILVVIAVLWGSYFLDGLKKSQNHFFIQNNNGLEFLKWVNKISKGKLVFQSKLFDDSFYLEDFSRVSLIFEVLFVVLLAWAAFLQKQKRKQYVLKILIGIVCFVILFEYLDATLKLFVSG